MNPSEEQKGTGVPPAGGASAGESSAKTPDALKPNTEALEPADGYDGYPHEPAVEEPVTINVKPEPPPTREVATLPRRPGGGGKTPPPPPPTGGGGEDDDGMLRMSFLEHLEELRTR